MPENRELQASFEHCRRVTREAARNFYYGFLLLPHPKQDALCALYAFMRRADDISDSTGDDASKQEGLAAWRRGLDRALEGEYGGNPVLPAFHHTVRQYGIPPRYLHDLISGTEMDLSITSYPTFERLREYCYRVAGTVGLTCLYVFGFTDPHAPELAEKLGIAFQLTNILRDLSSDLAVGRLYLPEEDLKRFGCSREELARGRLKAARELLQFEAERAWDFYEEGVELLPLINRDSQAALWALVRIYSGILVKIEERGYDVFGREPVGLSLAEKAWIAVRARLGWWPQEYALEKGDRDRRRLGRALLGRRAG